MGVPLFVHDTTQAVISPVAGRIEGAVRARLQPLTIVVATGAERSRIAKTRARGQRIEVLTGQPVEPSTVTALDARQSVPSLFRALRH